MTTRQFQHTHKPSSLLLCVYCYHLYPAAMAKFNSFSSLVLMISLLFVLGCDHQLMANAQKLPYLDSPIKCNLDKIYNLGDSLSDTGNLIRESVGSHSAFARPPYGETLFRNATGRCSNGLLMIDFLALSAGLPLLKPYKESGADFEHGVNFAVAGSTALPVETLAAMHIISPVTASSLDVQLGWMNSHFNSTCNSECKQRNANSLFMVGEIGGNDYNYGLFQRKSIQELENMVPQVVASISNAVKKVIDFGATRVVVPGNLPIGCLPIYLTGFQTNDTAAYDNFHCLKDLNNFSIYHNDHLKQAIDELNIQYPNVTIVYGDYYNAFMWVFSRAPFLGFDLKFVQQACCGTGGDYNFDLTKMCGAPETTVCPNPYRCISWDGVHLTHHAYKLMAGWLMRSLSPQLQCII